MPSSQRTTPQEPLLSEDELLADICRSSFYEFVKEFWECIPGAGKLSLNFHIRLFCDEFELAARRVFAGLPREYDLVFNVPPGTTKTSILSILSQGWIWACMPGARIICGTHTDSLVHDIAYKARDVINSEKYKRTFKNVTLRQDKGAVEDYANNRGGERKSCTVGGKSPTGRHAHFVLLDDPLDPVGARSEAELETARKFITEVIPLRVVDKVTALTVLVMQRLAPKDPSAVMFEVSRIEGAIPIKLICLPGEIVPGAAEVRPSLEELRRRYGPDVYKDGILDPIRLPKNILVGIEARLGRFAYGGQILQNPSMPGAGMFREDWFRFRVRSAPYAAKRVRYWDRASTCLLYSTEVQTSVGPKKIKDIREGDYVLTRKGYKRVLRSGQTGMVDDLVAVKYSNGSVLVGTPEHMVWTDNFGWTELSRQTEQCSTISCYGEEKWEDQSARDMRQFTSLDIDLRDLKEKLIISKDGFGERRKERFLQNCCTELSGNTLMERFLQDLMSIIRMEIEEITEFPILSVFQEKTITEDMGFLKDGIRLKQLKSITRKSPELHGQNGLQLNSFVVPAKKTRHGRRNQESIAQVDAKSGCLLDLKSLEEDILSKKKGFKSVFPEVLIRLSLSSVLVYDLTVEGEHEFFANGILVHNSQDERGAATAGVLMAIDDSGTFYVEDVVHGRWEPNERNDKMHAIALQDRLRYGPKYEPTIVIEAERGSTGLESYQSFARRLAGFKIKEDKPTGSKDTRAEPWADQLAAGNVRIVDGGQSQGLGQASWNIDGYIQEHTDFRPDVGSKKLGRWKDRVDSSSGAFNWLVSKRPPARLHVFVAGKKKGMLKIVVVGPDEINRAVIEDHFTILVTFQDPDLPDYRLPSKEAITAKTASSEGLEEVESGTERKFPVVPFVPNQPPLVLQNPYGLSKLIDKLNIKFADIDPKEYQEKWNKEIEPWDKKPEEIIMKKEDGKKLWSFLLKKRTPAPEVIVLQDNGDRRAMSVAMAICKVLNLPLNSTIFPVVNTFNQDNNNTAGGEEGTALLPEVPPNPHAYEIVKSSRMLVVS